MNFTVEKNEQYALISPKTNVFGDEVTPDLEKIIRNLYREGYCNIILDFSAIQEIDGYGISLIRKVNKICLNEMGLLIVVSKSTPIIDQLDGAKIEDLTILPTVEEAVDAIFMNELENEFKEGEDDSDFGFEEENRGRDDDY
jgi:hypothetical protein